MNYLISYPRSGNTWFRYCIEYISERPTVGYLNPGSSSFDRESIGKFAGIHTTPTEPILIKRHSFEPCFDEGDDKIIVLVRNYQEVIIRHTEKITFESFQSSTIGEENEIDYYSIIKQYDKWKGDKLLIYYEDLISNLQETLYSSCSFLMGDKNLEKVGNILDNLEDHKQKSINVYNMHSRSATRGESLSYHSRKIDEAERKRREDFIRAKDPSLYDIYLKKYEENTHL